MSGSGTLYSYTVQRYQPPPIFALADWAPYALGLVDLGQGLRVLGMVRGVAPEEVWAELDRRFGTSGLAVKEARKKNGS